MDLRASLKCKLPACQNILQIQLEDKWKLGKDIYMKCVKESVYLIYTKLAQFVMETLKSKYKNGPHSGTKNL